MRHAAESTLFPSTFFPVLRSTEPLTDCDYRKCLPHSPFNLLLDHAYILFNRVVSAPHITFFSDINSLFSTLTPIRQDNYISITGGTTRPSSRSRIHEIRDISKLTKIILTGGKTLRESKLLV